MKRDESSRPLSDEARALLRGARGTGQPRARTRAERERTEGRVLRLGAMPVVASVGWLFWAKGAALAAGVSLAAGTVAVLKHRYEQRETARVASAETTRRGPAQRAARVVAAREPVAPVAVPPAPPAVPMAPPSAPAASAFPSAFAGPIARRPVASARPHTALPSAVAPASVTAEPPAAPPVAAPVTVVPPEPMPARPRSLDDETELMREAHEALRGSPHEALALAERHRAEFASGQFVDEREFVAVSALVRLHRLDEARRRGETLLQRAPRSPAAARVRALFADAGVGE